MSEQNLAILGGEPAFAEPLHVGRPNVGDRRRLMQRIEGVLEGRWLTNDGPLVREFEGRLADYLGVEHCVAMANGTIALEILIRAAGLTGEVIVPSYTFIATAHALQWQEITPVFCDVDPTTHCIDPECIEQLVTPRTTGIIGVHLWGRSCDVEALQRIATRHDLKLLFDAAHAFGCTYREQRIGGFGLAEVFSFHATKFVNSGEGGVVATNDDSLAGKVRLMRNFGFAGYDRVIYIGTNGKMNEISAAIGLTSLERMDDFIEVNRKNYEAYRTAVDSVPGVEVLRYDPRESPNYQYVVVEVDEERAGLTRDQIVEVLHAENVLARRYFYPGCHAMEPYRSYYPNSHLLLPVTKKIASRVLHLPSGTAVDERIVRRITAILHAAVRSAAEVSSRLAVRSKAAPTTALPPW